MLIFNGKSVFNDPDKTSFLHASKRIREAMFLMDEKCTNNCHYSYIMT